MIGALLVRRIRWWGEGRAACPRNCALPMTEDEVVRAYRGIDGEPWLEALGVGRESDGLADLATWDQLEQAASDLTKADIFDAIVVTEGEAVPGFTWLGYDVGCVGANNAYSSLVHESINGRIDALRAHAASLNSALLLPGRAELDAYLATRARLLASGADVEKADACKPLAIWARVLS